jgi:hypothetical protein
MHTEYNGRLVSEMNTGVKMADGYWVNRSLCDVLEEMRKCYETRNFAPLMGLIEEAQTRANRMEAGLNDQKDIARMNEEWHELRAKLKELRTEAKALGYKEGE